MMNEKDIRIGNLIASGKEFNEITSNIGKVLSIGSDEAEFEQVYCELKESFSWFFKGNYCGIPLTPEWLERCGFEMVDDEIDYSEWENKAVVIHGNGSDKQEPFYYRWDFDGSEYKRELTHVHDLQNLFWSLTGTELEIKPQ